jgi:uncharacterized sodium:solute symporter family permease YidK
MVPDSYPFQGLSGMPTVHLGAIDYLILGSRVRSVPEYLKLRFDEKTRGFNAISFAVMTIFSSGISMYALAKLLGIMGDAGRNPMGVEWFGMAFGLVFVLGFGYWCTDFLVVQRALAADSMSAARL